MITGTLKQVASIERYNLKEFKPFNKIYIYKKTKGKKKEKKA
jgi:hypothetical protein